jgi:hypothetical protein
LRGRRGTRVIAPGDDAHDRPAGQVEEVWRSTPRLRVRRAHEGVADHPDPELVVRHLVSRSRSDCGGRPASRHNCDRSATCRDVEVSRMHTSGTKPLCRRTPRETIPVMTADETSMSSAPIPGAGRGAAQ